MHASASFLRKSDRRLAGSVPARRPPITRLLVKRLEDLVASVCVVEEHDDFVAVDVMDDDAPSINGVAIRRLELGAHEFAETVLPNEVLNIAFAQVRLTILVAPSEPSC